MKYSLLAPMEACEQAFPIILQCFDIPPQTAVNKQRSYIGVRTYTARKSPSSRRKMSKSYFVSNKYHM